MRRLGVRVRITLLATLVVLAVLVLTSLGLLWQQRQVLTEALDESLEERWAEVASAAGDLSTPISGLGEDDAFAQVVDGEQVVAASANVRGLGRVVHEYPPRFETVAHVADGEGAYRVRVGEAGALGVLVGAPLDDIDESVAALTRSLLLGVPLVVGTLAAILWWVVGRALRPVEAIRSEVAEIGGRDLHRRVPVPAADDEVGRLARTMNDMLRRVEVATRRQQRFLADASHELRSPLTRMRAELEVDLAHPARADLLATHASVLEETVGLQRLADDLLLVARADGGVAAVGSELVDLDDVVLRVARRLRADDRVRVDLSHVSAGRVRGDPDQLARLVGNIADNAVRHAASVVALSLVTEGEQVVLSVADDGPGVPVADRGRIFERFARVDDARRTADGGAGLGLAIARDIAEQHQGTLGLDPDAAGARFVLTLPAAPSTA